jgi:hypothetical protein
MVAISQQKQEHQIKKLGKIRSFRAISGQQDIHHRSRQSSGQGMSMGKKPGEPVMDSTVLQAYGNRLWNMPIKNFRKKHGKSPNESTVSL